MPESGIFEAIKQPDKGPSALDMIYYSAIKDRFNEAANSKYGLDLPLSFSELTTDSNESLRELSRILLRKPSPMTVESVFLDWRICTPIAADSIRNQLVQSGHAGLQRSDAGSHQNGAPEASASLATISCLTL